jgi:iron complex transport system substrate-binding protein
VDLARGAAESAESTGGSLDDITGVIVDASYRLYRGLGPGLLESVYEAILARDLARRGLVVERQRSLSFEYDGLQFANAFRVDLLVNRRVAVEIKSAEQSNPIYSKQVLTYLRLLKLEVGLLINFGAPTFKDGVRRIVNGLDPSASPRLRVNQKPPNACSVPPISPQSP